MLHRQNCGTQFCDTLSILNDTILYRAKGGGNGGNGVYNYGSDGGCGGGVAS